MQYSITEVKILKELFSEGCSLSEMASALNKTEGSIRAKLIHLNLYNKQELIEELERIIPCESQTNLKYARKETLEKILELLKNTQTS